MCKVTGLSCDVFKRNRNNIYFSPNMCPVWVGFAYFVVISHIVCRYWEATLWHMVRHAFVVVLDEVFSLVGLTAPGFHLSARL